MPSRFIFGVAAATIAATASAQSHATAPVKATAPQPIPRATFLQNMNSDFSKMDANHDGKLTRQEIEAYQRSSALAEIMARNHAIFVELDKDHNGQLSPSEFAQFHADPPPANAAPMLQQFDSNHDGIIDLIEFRTKTLANFDRLDTNKDGVVDAAEMKAGGIARH